MVFQDPYSAFNPVFRISHGVMRNLALHRPELARSERRAEAERVCESVELSPEMLSKFPHEMSGGERQRVGFAQALAVHPRLILADEPVSMLDVSIRAGVLNMMANLREEEGVSILYITHDIASARYVADRVVVMYAGHQVETGPTEEVLADPKHPYTQLLLSAAADPRDEVELDLRRQRRAAQGDQPERGLPLSLALSAGDREVLRDHAAAHADRLPRGRLPRGRRRGRVGQIDLFGRRTCAPAPAGTCSGRPGRACAAREQLLRIMPWTCLPGWRAIRFIW